MMCVKWTQNQMPLFMGCIYIRSLMILHVLIYILDLSYHLWIVLFCGLSCFVDLKVIERDCSLHYGVRNNSDGSLLQIIFPIIDI